MANRKIAYLINPISGTRSKEKVLELIKKKTTEQGIPFEILATNAEGNYNFIKEKVRNEGLTDVVICGGDGSISKITGALLDQDIRFGIIPMGSGNGLALSARIPRNTSKALDIIFNCKDDRVDGIMINGVFSCMLCGLGFDAAVAAVFANSKVRGLKTYVKLSALHYLKAQPYPFIIEANGHTVESAAYFISIANSNQFGNNFTIAPKASLQDGLLDIVIVKGMNKLVLPFSILTQITGINALQEMGELIDKKNIIYFQTDKLIIRNPQLAPLQTDGEPVETSDEFEITVLPKAYRLIQPFV